MNYKYTDDPAQYSGFFFAENKISNPEDEYIIHLGFPRFIVKWDSADGFFADFKSFWELAELQWLDPDKEKPDNEQLEYWMTQAWNYLTIEDRILEDYEAGREAEDDDEF